MQSKCIFLLLRFIEFFTYFKIRIYMNEFIIINYFLWLRMNIPFSSVLRMFYSTTHLFQASTSQCWPTWVGSSIIQMFPQLFALVAVLLRLSVLLNYLVDFLSFPYTSALPSLSVIDSETVSVHPIVSSDYTHLKVLS